MFRVRVRVWVRIKSLLLAMDGFFPECDPSELGLGLGLGLELNLPHQPWVGSSLGGIPLRSSVLCRGDVSNQGSFLDPF